jgi:hypothetical protein
MVAEQQPSDTAPATDMAACCGAVTADGCCGGTQANQSTTLGKSAVLKQVAAARIEGTEVQLSKSSAENVNGERVRLERSSAVNVEGRLVQLDNSSAVRVDSSRVAMQNGAALGVVAEQARFVRSRVIFSVARAADVDENTKIFMHIGPTMPCTKPTFGAGGAFGLGAGLGVALFALKRLVQRS